MKPEYVRCRSLGHAWIEGDHTYYRVSEGEIGQALTCERCGTTRIDLLDAKWFELRRRRYLYPEGYEAIRNAAGEPYLRSEYRALSAKRAGVVTPSKAQGALFDMVRGAL